MTARATPATPAPGLLRIAEDELQRLRGQLATVAAFIHDPAHDLSARRALAHLVKLPQPVPRPVGYFTTATVVPAVPNFQTASPSAARIRTPPVCAPDSGGGGEEPSTALEKATLTPDATAK